MSQPRMKLKDAVDEYMSRLRGQRGAEATIRTTGYTLKRLVTWLDEQRMPSLYAHLFDLPVLEKYLFGPGGLRDGGPTGREISAATFNQQRAVLNGFFVYCVQRKWMEENPIETVRRAKREERRDFLLLSGPELLGIMEGANPRDRAALSVGMNTGLRANDLTHLTIGDANFTNGLLATDIRKTKKLDQKPMTMDLEAELRRWLGWYSKLAQIPVADLPNDWTLLPPMQTNRGPFLGWKVKPRSFLTHPEKVVHRALGRHGFSTFREGFHTLRRSSARHLFDILIEDDVARDSALLVVRDYCNHSSVMQTEIYIGLNRERTIRNQTLKGQAFLGKTKETTVASAECRDDVETMLGERRSG